MDQVRIGIIGAAGRGSMGKHWHDPAGRSVVVGAADTAAGALDAFRARAPGSVRT